MMKRVLFGTVAGLGLVSASQPPSSLPVDPAAYPPCSRTVTDHCIQLYERGVRAPRPARAAGQPAPQSDDELTSVMAVDDQPRIEMASADVDPAPQPRRTSHRVRRAGERG